MLSKMNLFRLSTFCLITICATFAKGDLATNGSFENPQSNDSQVFGFGQIVGNGWNVVSGGTVYLIPDAVGQGTTPFGSQFAEIHGDAIAQAISGLTIGQSYRMNYWVTGRSDNQYFGTATLMAAIAGNTDLFQYSLFGNNPYGTAVPWQMRSIDFVATSNVEILSFTANGAFNSLPLTAIDNVSISAVPEPTSLLLALSGAACMASQFRRNKRKSL